MSEKRVLIIDDEESIRSILSDMLKIFGNECDCMEDGESAVQHLSKNSPHYHAVFLDLHMPGIDGFETLRRIRSIDPDIPVYIVSGAGDTTQNDELIAIGATGILPKPFRIKELQNILENLKV